MIGGINNYENKIQTNSEWFWKLYRRFIVQTIFYDFKTSLPSSM